MKRLRPALVVVLFTSLCHASAASESASASAALSPDGDVLPAEDVDDVWTPPVLPPAPARPAPGGGGGGGGVAPGGGDGSRLRRPPPDYAARIFSAPGLMGSVPLFQSELSPAVFRAFFKGRFPVVYRRSALDSVAVTDALDKGPLLRDAGNTTVRLASSNSFSHAKKDVLLKEYLYLGGTDRLAPGAEPPGGQPDAGPQHRLRYTDSAPANETWYLFGDEIGDEWARVKALYRAPLDSGEDDPALAVGVAGQFSGVGFHSHGAAWSETLRGAKRWFLAPPRARPAFSGDEHMLLWTLREAVKPLDAEDEGGEGAPANATAAAAAAAAAGGTYYGRLADACDANLRARGLLDSPGRLQLAWLPGHLEALSAFDLHVVDVQQYHVLYVPPGWWHATLNIGSYNSFVSTFTHEAPGWADRPMPEWDDAVPGGWVRGEEGLGAGPPEGERREVAARGPGGAAAEGARAAAGAGFSPHGRREGGGQ